MQKSVIDYLKHGSLVESPHKIAVVDKDSSFTFKQLDDLSDRLASLIADSSDQIQMPIAVFLEKSANTVIADLAIIKSGNFYTNLDEKSPQERLKILLENVTPVLILTTSALMPKLAAFGTSQSMMICVDKIDIAALTVNKTVLEERQKRMIDTDPLCLINTSGSTGVPKSVVLNHRSTIDFIDWCLENFDFKSSDKIGSLSPLYFDIYTLELFVALKTGATIFLIPEQCAAFPVQLVQFLSENEITFIFWVPTIMVNIANLKLLEKFNLQNLRRVFFAGEVFPTKQLNVWRKILNKTQFVNLYGPIEITVDCTFFVLNREFDDEDPIPIGLPCANSDVFILTDKNKLARRGEIGELCVRGSSLALGYYNNPAQTATSFVQNPLNDKFPEIIYRTGDLVHTNEVGEIMFDGRKDYQIKHQGYRIELVEIENAVQALPEIRNACVLYQSDKKEIVLIFEASSEVASKQIRQALQSKLPKYMLPSVFIEVSEMPRNPNGKIDRQKLNDEFG
jgi:amino acid adenylation domain-containing protein